MDHRTQGLILMCILLILSFIFQIQSKLLAGDLYAVMSRANHGFQEKAYSLLFALLSWRPLFVAALALALFSVWLLALTRLELSMALPIASVALIINAIGSGLLLGEAMTMTRVIGVLTVAAGIGLVLKS
jgi:uncharacterized membrane protein